MDRDALTTADGECPYVTDSAEPAGALAHPTEPANRIPLRLHCRGVCGPAADREAMRGCLAGGSELRERRLPRRRWRGNGGIQGGRSLPLHRRPAAGVGEPEVVTEAVVRCVPLAPARAKDPGAGPCHPHVSVNVGFRLHLPVCAHPADVAHGFGEVGEVDVACPQKCAAVTHPIGHRGTPWLDVSTS